MHLVGAGDRDERSGAGAALALVSWRGRPVGAVDGLCGEEPRGLRFRTVRPGSRHRVRDHPAVCW